MLISSAWRYHVWSSLEKSLNHCMILQINWWIAFSVLLTVRHLAPLILCEEMATSALSQERRKRILLSGFITRSDNCNLDFPVNLFFDLRIDGWPYMNHLGGRLHIYQQICQCLGISQGTHDLGHQLVCLGSFHGKRRSRWWNGGCICQMCQLWCRLGVTWPSWHSL